MPTQALAQLTTIKAAAANSSNDTDTANSPPSLSKATHPMIREAMRDSKYLVWTNIGC